MERVDIIRSLQSELKIICEKPQNQFGMGLYDHIVAVVKNGEFLAEQCGADKEVVSIASWLHDIASATDYSLYKNHHIHGAEIAYNMLTELNYDEDKIELVQKCIRNHRGSIKSERSTIEEICVADADAISHFDSIPSLLFLEYAIRNNGYIEGKEFVRKKLERSFDKLSDRSKELYKDKYNRAMDFIK